MSPHQLVYTQGPSGFMVGCFVLVLRLGSWMFFVSFKFPSVRVFCASVRLFLVRKKGKNMMKVYEKRVDD